MFRLHGEEGQTGNMLGIKLYQHIQIATRFCLTVQARAEKSQTSNVMTTAKGGNLILGDG